MIIYSLNDTSSSTVCSSGARPASGEAADDGERFLHQPLQLPAAQHQPVHGGTWTHGKQVTPVQVTHMNTPLMTRLSDVTLYVQVFLCSSFQCPRASGFVLLGGNVHPSAARTPTPRSGDGLQQTDSGDLIHFLCSHRSSLNCQDQLKSLSGL